MTKEQKIKQVKAIGLFLVVAFAALSLIVTFSSAMTAAAGNSGFRVFCAVFTLAGGAYAIYKASRKVMEPFTKDEEKL